MHNYRCWGSIREVIYAIYEGFNVLIHEGRTRWHECVDITSPRPITFCFLRNQRMTHTWFGGGLKLYTVGNMTLLEKVDEQDYHLSTFTMECKISELS